MGLTAFNRQRRIAEETKKVKKEPKVKELEKEIEKLDLQNKNRRK